MLKEEYIEKRQKGMFFQAERGSPVVRGFRGLRGNLYFINYLNCYKYSEYNG